MGDDRIANFQFRSYRHQGDNLLQNLTCYPSHLKIATRFNYITSAYSHLV